MDQNELRARIAEALKDNTSPPMPVTLAERFGVTELEAMRAMPDELCAVAPASAFEDIWNELTTWESATVIVQYKDSVFEIKTKLVPAKYGRGYYNLFGDQPLGGHLYLDELEAIAMASIPFMGRESHSVQFFHKDGTSIFAVYVGRENHKLIPSVRESFLKLKARYAAQN